jgi:hypothetical protein
MLITSSVPRSCLGPPRVGAACGLAWNRMGCRGRRLCADLPTPHFSLRGSVSRSQSRAAAEAHLLRCCYGITRGGVVLQQEIDAAEKYIRTYGCEPLDPSRHQTGRNTQENGESLYAPFQDGNSRYDTSMSFVLHQPPLVGVIPARCPVYNVGQVLQWGPLCGSCIGMSTMTCAAVRPRAATGRFGLV